MLVTHLELGDCFNDPPDWSSAPDEITEVLAVNVVSCSQSHDDEVVGLTQHPADEDAPFPGDDALILLADTKCLDAFERWVGRSYYESSLEIGFLWPAADSWAVGDRTIRCVAYLPGGLPLDESVRDSAM